MAVNNRTGEFIAFNGNKSKRKVKQQKKTERNKK